LFIAIRLPPKPRKDSNSHKCSNTLINICLVFFGFYCLLIGYLVFRSTFLPRILGADGNRRFGLADLSATAARKLSVPPYDLASCLLGEGSVFLWLLVMGANVQRWKEQANAAGASIRT